MEEHKLPIIKKTKKIRADVLLVKNNQVETRQKAQALIMQGSAYDPSGKIIKPGTLLDESHTLIVKEQLPYVGRGGVKMAHALKTFDIDVADLTILDVGASTGGFTDCAIQRGASHIYALDVGHGQIHHSLQNKPNITIIEKTNARYPFDLPTKVHGIFIDVAFISNRLILPEVSTHLKNDGFIICLIKPQFEAGQEYVGYRGVIRDPKVHEMVITDFKTWAQDNKFNVLELCDSPISGRNGNKEFFAYLTKNLD
jgi:23S rRNA (cytidine1920-2'-O)/16S rRNA (cytidine1409-2'-O)-methyltransferase